jgi:signal transduction histidine kinase
MTELIRSFFALNQIIIIFIYGQVFFVLGLVIVVQSWRHSRLALARNLTWLAAFGVSHGLYEWGDIFIPIQAEYMVAPFIDLMLGVQLVLLAISLACLFQFGVETLRPLPERWRWLRLAPGAITVLWVFLAFGPTSTMGRTPAEWSTLNNILARYSMGFPGALLAAYALRRQARTMVAPWQVPHVWGTLRIAGLALAAYSVLAGLAVPPGDFFPANWFNTAIIEQWTLVPIQVYRSLAGLSLTLAIIRALEVFRVELDRQVSQLEEQQILISERERIGRELHDGTLQSIYAAGLLLRTTEKELVEAGSAHGAGLQQSLGLLNQAVADIRGYIGTLRSSANGRSLADGLKELAAARHLRSLVEVKLELDLPDDQALSSARIGHLLAITNEALSNVVRHAEATQVSLSALVNDDTLHLAIQDNGRGLPVDYVRGYGLRNMRDRARMLGGDLSLASMPNQGTTITVEIPWSEADENHSSAVG